jgi:cbb3-type cytochrome oxidase subunit 3
MNKKWATVFVIAIILVFIGYMVFDLSLKKEKVSDNAAIIDSFGFTDQWTVSKVFEPGLGKLNAVAASENGGIILAGVSFVSGYTSDLNVTWTLKTEKPVTSVSVSGDTVFAATMETILAINNKGALITEWGPIEDSSIITSVTSNKTFLAIADAQNKRVTILDKKGNVRKMIGLSGEPFIVPSPYFDVALTGDNMLYVANPGNRRIEERNIDGTIVRFFGVPGLAPAAFCGCCNPAHFTLIPGGFVTAEKGINRIKILNEKGEFTELVSSKNNFMAPIPLDVASADGKIIYAANPADGKLYVFKRK